MKLRIPKEPKEILERIKTVRKEMGDSDINWDSFAIWHANQLPQYLWNEWKEDLKTRGFTWQKFLKLLRTRTDSILGWFKGVCTWEKMINDILVLLGGALNNNFIDYSDGEIEEIKNILEKEYLVGTDYIIENLKINFDNEYFFKSSKNDDTGVYLVSLDLKGKETDIFIIPFATKSSPVRVAFYIAFEIWSKYDHSYKSKLWENIPTHSNL